MLCDVQILRICLDALLVVEVINLASVCAIYPCSEKNKEDVCNSQNVKHTSLVNMRNNATECSREKDSGRVPVSLSVDVHQPHVAVCSMSV